MIWLLAAMGGAGGAVLLALRPYAFYFVVFMIVTTMAGMVQYYARIDAAWWAATAAAVALFVRDWIENRAARTSWVVQRGSYLYVLAAFFGWALFVSLLNKVSQPQLLVAIKNYALIWTVAPVVAHLAAKRLFYARVEFALIGLMLLQGPVAFVQRLSAKHWDAVVGTFGGNPDGGGASGTMMLYCVVGVLVGTSLWQRGKAPLWATIGLLLLSFVIVSLGEVKAFFFLLPLGLIVQQRRRALRSPIQAALLLGAMTVGSYVVVGIYSTDYTVTASRSDQLYDAVLVNFDPNNVSETGEVSRGASLALWSRYAGPDVLHRMIGYGAGASRRSSTVSVGVLATRFGSTSLDATVASELLWDTGVIGLFLFGMIFIAALRASLRASRNATTLAGRARADTLAALFAVAIPMIVYDRSLIDLPAVEFLYATALGLLAALEQTQRNTVRPRSTRPARQPSQVRPVARAPV